VQRILAYTDGAWVFGPADTAESSDSESYSLDTVYYQQASTMVI